MIPNPPPIIYLLRAYRLLLQENLPEGDLAAVLAAEFRRKLGPMAWTTFQATYHLYLQTIPLAIARAAWGINEALSTKPQVRNKEQS